MEEIIYVIVVFFLLLLIIIYLLIAVFTLNQKIIENENIFFVEKDKLIMHTLEQQKISKINKEKKKYTNKKIIGIDNNRSNIIIGVCIGYGRENGFNEIDEYPIIQDYITQNQILFKGKMMFFSDILFNALCKLSFEDRMAIIDIEYKASLIIDSDKKLNKYEIMEILEKNGFYEKN